jgi:hypothetical protein
MGYTFKDNVGASICKKTPLYELNWVDFVRRIHGPYSPLVEDILLI